ncbi:MAG: ABC transporter permease [Pseudomonadota bacterium]
MSSDLRPAVPLPRWVSVGVVPLVNVGLALLVSGLVIWVVGESPVEAVRLMVFGAFGYGEAIGYTLFYATNFIFTGLAVAVAFHAGLFNIGGEGQAYVGGLGMALIALSLDASLPGWVLIPLCLLAGAAFGAFWGFVPGWLQAHRGSHIVITTIMFNFIAAALLGYMLVSVIIGEGQMAPETRAFAESTHLPYLHEMAAWFGLSWDRSPVNFSLLISLVCAVGVWVYIWHTRWGYALRCVGQGESAAVYAGIDPKRVVVLTMCLSGALAGLMGLNEILGTQHRLLLNFTAGYGFTGIAVALMGRNHPFGIVVASLLFGALYQGGAELAFDMPTITREMVVAIQGLVILFSGALAYMSEPWVARAYGALVGKRIIAEGS